MNYLDIVARLPIPAPEQTTQFADHVADNHSWYKHLPFFPPGAKFVFFPAAHAGQEVRRNDDVFELFDIDEGSYFRHHSRLATADYRHQFGHWDYWVDDNPRSADPADGPWIYGLEGGQRERLPENLKQSWSCRLTAFLRPMPTMFRLRPNELEREAQAFAAYAAQYSADPAIARNRTIAAERPQAGSSSLGAVALWDMLEVEAQAQKALLKTTLERVRQAWAAVRGGCSGSGTYHATPSIDRCRDTAEF